MKLAIFAVAFSTCDAAFLRSGHGHKDVLPEGSNYGNRKCPCIGFDGIEGSTDVPIGNSTLPYPADLGGSCEAWDAKRHPDCQGSQPASWCHQQWCYVDPRDCDIPVLPKPSSYQPDANYQGLPIYYSYATCGAKDTWAEEVHEYGSYGCRCVGFDDSPGKTLVDISGKTVEYPAELGGECKAWDESRHPECWDWSGTSQPEWCKQKWCYVDPCACDAVVPPKVSSFLPNATFRGKPVYYSYNTCGGVDSYTAAEHSVACVNQKSASTCQQLEKCAWNGEKCLGKDLVHACAEEPSGFGHEDCQCVGFDNIEGSTDVPINGEKLAYPADLGGRCEAWDANRHPDCKSNKKWASWCEQQWCYVDPRACAIPVLPKPSAYQPDAMYQGLPVSYSYATCGGQDTWAAEVHEYGADGCRCVGFDDSVGKMMVEVQGAMRAYPAETGGECKAWDETRHPDCGGPDQPAWCSQKWCYVDPCSCTSLVPPKTSAYLPEAAFQGRPVYYSYHTCGGTDSFTSKEHKSACVNQKTQGACHQQVKCAWSGGKCLGKDLVQVCNNESPASEPNVRSAAFALTPLIALVALLIAH